MCYVAGESGALLLELNFFRRERTALGPDLIFYVHNSHHWSFEQAKLFGIQISICLFSSLTPTMFERLDAKSTAFAVESFEILYIPIKIWMLTIEDVELSAEQEYEPLCTFSACIIEILLLRHV